ncbi:MAG: hypothetical protein V2A56_02805 [bacterium]
MNNLTSKSMEDLSHDSKLLLDALNREDDLACVLIATSYIDKILIKLLKSCFLKGSTSIEVLGDEKNKFGFIDTYIKKIKLSYCLGILEKGLFVNLDIIGQIRNIMAHDIQYTSFNDDMISKLCLKLKFPVIQGVYYDGRTKESGKMDKDFLETKYVSPRMRFMMVALMVADALKSIDLKQIEAPSGKWG